MRTDIEVRAYCSWCDTRYCDGWAHVSPAPSVRRVDAYAESLPPDWVYLPEPGKLCCPECLTSLAGGTYPGSPDPITAQWPVYVYSGAAVLARSVRRGGTSWMRDGAVVARWPSGQWSRCRPLATHLHRAFSRADRRAPAIVAWSGDGGVELAPDQVAFFANVQAAGPESE